ncbi:MAG: hypothetical protein BroJett038_01890 [Chloroflexota bacterium]|nr:MAG: hypothetical protein BroJett038_01890 [Chloroflexota bacterium]
MSPTIYPDRPDPQPEPSEPLFQPSEVEDETYESPFEASGSRQAAAHRGSASDPVFGYLVILALSVGLMPLIPDNADLRYVILWAAAAGFGVMAWLLGSTTRIGQETPENLLWGFAFGLIIGIPLLAVGGTTLHETARRLFPDMRVGEVLAFLLFVMPLAETLFFRGLLQENRPFWLVGLLGSLWSALVFVPMLDAGRYPAVAVVIVTALVMMNVIYSYVRRRNGLAAAWVCQIVANLVLLFLPFL